MQMDCVKCLELVRPKLPGCGVFKNIDEVKPGHFMKFSAYGTSDFTYYRITSTPHTDSYEDTVKKVRYLVKDSIEKTDCIRCTYLHFSLRHRLINRQQCVQKLKEESSFTHSHLTSRTTPYISSQMHFNQSRIDHTST